MLIKQLTFVLAATLVAGCGMAGDQAETDVAYDQGGSLQEAVFSNNKLCQFVFHGTSSPDAEIFFIWNLGIDGVLQGEAYPTDARANLFAIFAPAPANATHHVDGFDQFDHYHIVDAAPGSANYDETWDVFLVFPGPNFDAATYTTATNAAAMQAQIAAGILGPALKTTEAGFDPLVLSSPLTNCKRP